MVQGGLKKYDEKRDFSQTPEPHGLHTKHKSRAPIFVIQRHNASHLHYDLRLEIDGVLVSWALPKDPPLVEGVKRLAIQTEDHPMAYASFEGTIPEGQYGAGTVEIWDHGTFESIKEKAGEGIDLGACLKNGQIEVYFSGNKITGPYALIRTNMAGTDKKQWLFFKMKSN